MLATAAQITASFYAWEIRGRGWQLADYPVSLEPPHRPLLLLPGAESSPQEIDDGKRPTLLNSFVEGAKRLFAGAPQPSPSAEGSSSFEEEPPYPALPRSRLVTFSIRVPPEYTGDITSAQQLLASLSTTLHPVAVEWVGTGGAVSLEIACDELDAEHVQTTVSGHAPEATVLEEGDHLADSWADAPARVVVDIGLANEFFLPLATIRTLKSDPALSLVSALAQAGPGECAVLQTIFERVRNPWGKTILRALNDGEGGCIFDDAPEFPALAREKTETTLFAVVCRIGASARSEERAWELLRAVAGYLLQFGRPGSNELVPLENEGYPEDLHEAALLRRESFRTGAILSARELVGLIHFPDSSLRHPALRREAVRTKGAPAETAGHPFIIGENLHRGMSEPVSLAMEQRLQHTHIVGATGTGKSTLLVNLIEQDIAHGEGLAVLDPHGDLIDDVIARLPEERVRDVVLFDPADEEWPIGFNILSAKSERERALLASDLVGIFQRLATSWGDAMTAVLGNAVLAILESTSGGTLLDLRRFLVDDGFRRSFLTNVPDEEVLFFWQRQYPIIGTRAIGPLLTRLDSFLRSKIVRHIVGQRDARLNLAEVIDEGKIFLAKLSQGMIGKENAALLGSILVSKFHQLALSRQATAKGRRRPFMLYVDEFQHFVTPSMGALLSEGRKYGLGLTLAHQTLAQLEGAPAVKTAVLANAYTRIVFRVSDEDAKELAGGFSFFEQGDLQRLSRGEAIMRVGSSLNDFNLRTVPATQVSAEVAEERMSRVIAESRERCGVPIDNLRARLAELYAPKESPPSEPEPPPIAVRHEEAVAADRAPVTAAEPTERAPKIQARPQARDPAPLGRGGAEHKYLQQLIKRLGEERGFRAVIESPLAEGRGVDVVLSRESLTVACEISVSTDLNHEIENLKKCASGAFTRILFVSADKRRRQKMSGALKGLPDLPVDVLAPEEVLTVLDALKEEAPESREAEVRGYKVKVKRQQVSYGDLAKRRSAIAEVIARSLSRKSP